MLFLTAGFLLKTHRGCGINMRELGVKIRVGTKKILGRQNTVPRKLHAFGAQKKHHLSES